MNENIKNAVLELLQDINLLDYMDRTELQILKDEYVDGSDFNTAGDIDDMYAMIEWLNSRIDFYDYLITAIDETLDSKLIYNSDCMNLLQIDLMESFDILNRAMIEYGADIFDSFDVRKSAIMVAYYTANNELRNELEFIFLENALGKLK